LPYEITQYYLPPDTSELAPPKSAGQVGNSIYLEGWKAELT